eukprot:s247_g14.t1
MGCSGSQVSPGSQALKAKSVYGMGFPMKCIQGFALCPADPESGTDRSVRTVNGTANRGGGTPSGLRKIESRRFEDFSKQILKRQHI